MVEFLLLLCFTLVVLFVLPIAFDKRYFAKTIIAAFITAISIYLIPGFYKLQRENGNPDAGKEFSQLYLPISIFIICALCGIIMFVYFLFKTIRENRHD